MADAFNAVDVSDKAAADFFDGCVTISGCQPKLLWQYTKGTPKHWKATISWSEAKKQRLALSDALDMTGGYQLKQKKFCWQLRQWLKKQGQEWSGADAEAAVYRLRAMMAHLRDFARINRKVPQSFAPMESLVSKILLDR